MGLRELINKRVTKTYKFMSEDIKIAKLTVAEITDIRAQAKKAQDSPDDADNLDILKSIIRNSVEGGKDLSDDDFNAFPMDDLSKLSSEIMKFSGLEAAAGEKGK